MLRYIPNRIDPENLDDWKNIMKNTINQIIQYPEAPRPYCDLSLVAPQYFRFIEEDENENEFGVTEVEFDNFYVNLFSDIKKRNIHYNINTGFADENSFAKATIKGVIPPNMYNHYINYRSFSRQNLELNESQRPIVKRFEMGTIEPLLVEKILAIPNLEKTWSEKIRDSFDGFFW